MNPGQKGILFVSNGYGEDDVASRIAAEISRLRPGLPVKGFPTVGEGHHYARRGIALAGKGLKLPSEGFIRSFRTFGADLSRGFIHKTMGLGLSIRRAAENADFLVITGDPYLLLFTTLFSRVRRERKIFIGLQQSEWYGSRKPFKEHYSFIERRWVRRFCTLGFVRDEKTSSFLREKGMEHILTRGNPMMDCFDTGDGNIFPEGRTVVGVLPGSRKEAYDNFGRIIQVLSRLERIGGGRYDFFFAVALSPNLDREVIAERYGLGVSELNGTERDIGFHGFTTADGVRLLFSTGLFGAIIGGAHIVLGLSGTGNEQAAGLGKPVAAFPGPGPQITEKFLRAQKRLLGISLLLCPADPEEIASRMCSVLGDAELLKRIAENGGTRMAGVGSVPKIAEDILRRVETGQGPYDGVNRPGFSEG